MKKFTFLSPILFSMVIVCSCAKMQEPVFKKIDNFRVKDISLTKGTVGFSVTYYNPNNFAVTVKETEADVYIDSVYMGKFSQDSLIAVGQKADFTIPISGSIPIGKMLELNLQNLSTREIFIKADGSTKVGKLGVYVTKPLHYQGKHKLGQIKL